MHTGEVCYSGLFKPVLLTSFIWMIAELRWPKFHAPLCLDNDDILSVFDDDALSTLRFKAPACLFRICLLNAWTAAMIVIDWNKLLLLLWLYYYEYII